MRAATAIDSDEADVRRVLGGEIDAFSGIVARWEGPLVNLAYRFCHDRDAAQEMAQDAFVKAFKTLKSWRGESKFSTWLFALTLNVFRSHLRRNPPRWASLEQVGNAAAASWPDQEYAAEEEATLVRKTVLTLPPKYREAIIVFYFHEKDIHEAAATLKIPEGTLKARLHRGRDLLRRKLAVRIDAEWLPETT